MNLIIQWIIWLVLSILMGIVAYWLTEDDDDCEEDD